MKKTFTLIITTFTLLFTTRLQAQTQPQTMPFGKVDMVDLQLKQCDFEKDANAMVLFDKADLYYDNQFNIVIERHKRIKIFNDKGKDEANVRLVFNGGNRTESIGDVQVETINENNGKPEITKIERKLIYSEVVDKYKNAIVFAFPNVKAGSIIEYKYRWQNTGYSIPSWYFQNRLPVRYSELSTEIPEIYIYKTPMRVLQPFVKNTTSTESHSEGSITYNSNKQTRALANIPSLTDEPYMRSRHDNLQNVEFQFVSYRPIGGFIQNFNDTWDKVGGILIEDEDFGSQLNKKLKGEDLIIAKAKTLKTDNDKIAYIFNEVKNRMKWNGLDRWYTIDGTPKAWETQTGNSTEINIALYHLLKQANIKGYPMEVSTRENGRVNPAIPNVNQFNRAVVYIPIDSTQQYVLDASDKYNVYNEIPRELLNSSGLYINREQKKFDMLFLQKELPARQVVIVDGDITPDGKLEGKAQVSSFSYHKLARVEQYKKDGEEKYKKSLIDDDNNLTITSLKLDNMDVDSLPLTQSIGFKLALAGSDEKYIYVNPNLFTTLKNNPFLSENRTTDIDFGNKNSYVISGNYKIPAGFKVDALPKSVNMVLPDKSISFRRIVAEEDGMVKINFMINYRKTIYYYQSYAELREFYKQMHTLLNEQIVLKKS
ncbi:MAG: DUF3857 domain-containing protein [Mucilaginibacter sp.]|uniref:DUF3857 domain-containing protein n=1 Tax=Mucilaginibacter sp. TaxID=1882438 RepID=UPI0032674003